ncbi:aldehyde dehydrogenase family protein [Streptomyces sp. NPDC002143]
MSAVPHWIDGRPYQGPAAEVLPVTDPATGEQIAEVALADEETVEVAADALAGAALGAAGQRCMAVSVAVAVADRADALIAALEQRAEAVTVGPGTAPGTEIGPVVSAAAQERIRPGGTDERPR